MFYFILLFLSSTTQFELKKACGKNYIIIRLLYYSNTFFKFTSYYILMNSLTLQEAPPILDVHSGGLTQSVFLEWHSRQLSYKMYQYFERLQYSIRFSPFRFEGTFIKMIIFHFLGLDLVGPQLELKRKIGPNLNQKLLLTKNLIHLQRNFIKDEMTWK